MYHTFFNLSEPAFSIAVNPRYLYMSQQHKEALAHLLYGVSGGSFVMLTGEVGTGKTTIIRCLLEQLPEQTDIAIILNPMADIKELLGSICDELHLGDIKNTDNPKDFSNHKSDLSIKQLTDLLYEFLLKNHSQGRNTVLLIDEAQLLSVNTLEQLRLLTNLETNTQKLLHIILVGQPELKELIAKPELRQLSQRITARFHLSPLTLQETHAYIQHRLKIAGLAEGRSPFPFSIVKKIHGHSDGIPRLINVICERCLVGAYALSNNEVSLKILNEAAREVKVDLHQTTPNPKVARLKKITFALFFIFLFAVIVFIIHLLFFKSKDNTQDSSTQNTSTQNASLQNTSSASSNKSLTTIDTQTQIESAAKPFDFFNNGFKNYAETETIWLDYLGFQKNLNVNPCGSGIKTAQAFKENNHYLNRIQCERTLFHTWEELQQINHPAILTLATPEKFSVYVVLIGINNDKGLILDRQGTQQIINLYDLGKSWTGEATYLWHKPPSYTEALNPGDQSPTITWTALQFAKLDNQIDPLTDDIFSIALQERIKLFQRAESIPITGNLNEITLMKLNDQLGIDKILESQF